jgi:hypothetical protein
MYQLLLTANDCGQNFRRLPYLYGTISLPPTHFFTLFTWQTKKLSLRA